MEILDSTRLLNVIGMALLVVFLWVLVAVRREHIRVEYSVSWLLAAGFLLVLSRWSTANLWLANVLGVGNPALALLLVVAGVFLVVLYRLSLRISELRDSNIKLAQRIAILQLKMESLDEEAKHRSQS